MLTDMPDSSQPDSTQPGGSQTEKTAKVDKADEVEEATAELDASFWHAYSGRLATVGFLPMLRELPSLIGQAVRLGYRASRIDLITTTTLNLFSGIFSGYALYATTGVLTPLFAAGPTPDRVKAALPSLAIVALATAARAGLQIGANWAESRLEPQVERLVEVELFDLTTRVELAAFDDGEFHDKLERARERGLYSAQMIVSDVINCLTGVVGIASAAVVVGLLHPLLLALLLLAELPAGWAAVRTAKIRYATRFALVDSYRRKYILTNLMADRRTAAELRSFTMRDFLLARVSHLAAYVRNAELTSARKRAITQGAAGLAGGLATTGVYVGLGILLALGQLPLAIAGTAILAIRSAQSSLSNLLFAVNTCYEDGLYFSDYQTFCADAESRLAKPGSAPVPAGFEEIIASQVTFTYPGADGPTLREVSLRIGRGQVVALVGENGSGKTTLAKVLAGLYQPDSGTVLWDATALHDVDPDLLREQIAVIAQDHANWPLSVRHNITMGRDLDHDRLGEAVAAAGAAEVIDGLAHGYSTLLDRSFKEGAELSGGQWQRVAVARGYYRAAPLLIMDEPTASLDARAEHALFTSVRDHAAGRSILMITHRLVSTRTADQIYVLDHGQVIEQGTHDELMERGGQYAELYLLQASQYLAETHAAQSASPG